MERGCRISSQENLSYIEVFQLMGALNWVSGLIPLGRLHIRPLQRHFHSLGLTNQFAPPRRSDPTGPILSHIRYPYPAFSGGVHHFHGRLDPGLGRPHWRFSNCRCVNPFQTRAPHQSTGAQGGNIGPPSPGYNITGPSCFDCYRQHHCCSLHQQTRWDPFPPPVAAGSGSVSVATDSGHNSTSHIPGCLNVIADRLSRPNQPIMTEWSLHPKVVNLIFRLWGTPVVDMFALSQDWQGRSIYIFPPFPMLNKVIQKLRTIQTGEVILIAPWWPSQPWFSHLLLLRVWTTHFQYRRDLLSQQGYISSGKSYHLHAWRLSCSTTKQQDFQRRSLSSPQLLGDPPHVECTTTVGYASLTGPQGEDLIHMVPQLLK